MKTILVRFDINADAESALRVIEFLSSEPAISFKIQDEDEIESTLKEEIKRLK